MKKVFILAALLTTPVFGFEYGTDQFNTLANNTYNACLDFYISEIVASKIDVKTIPDDKIELLKKLCLCQSYCVAEKTSDVSYIYDNKAQDRLAKTVKKCMRKCNNKILK